MFYSKVRVEIRIKPTIDDVLDISSTSVSLDKKFFEFDKVYNSSANHKDIFLNSVLPLTRSFLNLYNSTIFAYGQTGSGKTFTMGISIEALESYEEYLTSTLVLSSTESLSKETTNINQSLYDSFIEGKMNTDSTNDCNNDSIKEIYRPDLPTYVSETNTNALEANLEQPQFLDIPSSENNLNYQIQNFNIETKTSADTQNCNVNEQRYFGIVPDSFGYIFRHKKPNDKFSITLIEIYNEEVIDLLSDFRVVLTLRQINGETNIAGAKEIYVKDEREAIKTVKKGLLERTVKSTQMNLLSSRSHAILTLNLHRNENNKATIAKFTFVDLAGSERMKRTLAQGTTAKESISINGGLLSLSNVITALSKKSLFVPYRDSKLTRILQHGLGGNSNTLMLANISGSGKDVSETFNTLKYASRASSISNQIKKCIEIDANRTGVVFLRNEINRLKNENNELRNRLKNRIKSVEEERLNEINKENIKLREEIRKLRSEKKCEALKSFEAVKDLENEKKLKHEIEELKLKIRNLENTQSHAKIQELKNQIVKEETKENCSIYNDKSCSNKENYHRIDDFDPCKKKRIVTFDLEKNRFIDKNLSENVIFGGSSGLKNTLLIDKQDPISPIASNTPINNTIDIMDTKYLSPDNRLLAQNSSIHKSGKIEMVEPFILSLFINNDCLYASTLNGKIFVKPLKQSIDKFTLVLTEDDEIKKIVFVNNNLYYCHKNFIKKYSKTVSEVIKTENEISVFGIKKDFLIVGTINGLLSIYDLSNKDVPALFCEKIFTSTILCFQSITIINNPILSASVYDSQQTTTTILRPGHTLLDNIYDTKTHSPLPPKTIDIVSAYPPKINPQDPEPADSLKYNTTDTQETKKSTNILYVGSKDNKIACLKRDSITYLEDLHYSAVQCLLSIKEILISCGRDGCIKLYQNSKLLCTKMAHVGSIKSATLGKQIENRDTFYTGGKDGILKHWKITTDNTKIDICEIGCVLLDSCINDLVFDNDILYAACMNRHIYTVNTNNG